MANRSGLSYSRFMRRPSTIFAVAISLLACVGAEATELYVPVVAQVRGMESAYWNTELWATNVGESPGTLAVTFLPANENNGAELYSEGRAHSLDAGATIHLENVVPAGKNGALRLVTSGDVVVQCRLFNTTRSGSLGQIIPVLTRRDLIPAGAKAVLMPLNRSAGFRTNVGFFNPNGSTIRVQVAVIDGSGELVTRVNYTLPPGSQTQINDALLSYDVKRAESYRMVIEAEAAFAAYASLVDTRSGAPTLISPVVIE